MPKVMPRTERIAAPKRRLAASGAVFALFALIIIITTATNMARRELLPPTPLGRLAGVVEIAELKYRLALANGVIGPELRETARDAASRAPLADEPFVILGAYRMTSPAAKLDAAGKVALREALRRDPRSVAARLFLIRGTLAEGDVSGAIRQIVLLHRVDRQMAQDLVNEAGKAISSPAIADEAIGYLTPYPSLFDNLTIGLTSVERDSRLLRHYLERLPASATKRPAVRAALVERLVGNGEVELAFRLMREGDRARRDRPRFVDPGFQARKSDRPFAWELLETEVGVAERVPEGGIFVEYYGRRSGQIGRQLAVLAPGSYAANLEFEAANAAAIALKIRCAKTGEVLLSEPLKGTASSRRAIRRPFTVSPSCVGQWVEIVGLPQVVRRPAQAVLYRLWIERAGND